MFIYSFFSAKTCSNILWKTYVCFVSLKSLCGTKPDLVELMGFKVSVCVCETSDLADVDGRHLCGADWRVTRWVGERLARPDGQLLLLLGGHDLLGNCNTHITHNTNSERCDYEKSESHGFVSLMTLLEPLNIISFNVFIVFNFRGTPNNPGRANQYIKSLQRQLRKIPTFCALIGCL